MMSKNLSGTIRMNNDKSLTMMGKPKLLFRKERTDVCLDNGLVEISEWEYGDNTKCKSRIFMLPQDFIKVAEKLLESD